VVVVFFRDPVGYTAWCEEHPSGYVLNVGHKGSAGRLHRAECGTVWPHRTRSSDPTLRMKVCAVTREAVERWAHDRHETFAGCPNCDV
jgi:hypothetical protein